MKNESTGIDYPTGKILIYSFTPILYAPYNMHRNEVYLTISI